MDWVNPIDDELRERLDVLIELIDLLVENLPFDKKGKGLELKERFKKGKVG